MTTAQTDGSRRRRLDRFRFHPRVESNLRMKTLSELLVRIVRLLLWVAVARILGPAQFGLYSLALTFGSFFGMGSDFGLRLHMAREIARSEGSRITVLSRAVFAKSILTAVVLLILVGSVLLYPRGPEVRWMLFVAGAAFMAQSWTDFWDHWFLGHQAFRDEAILNLLHVGIWTTSALTLLALGAGPTTLLSTLFGAALVTTLFAIPRARRLGAQVVSVPYREALETFREASPIGIASVLTSVYFRIDQILLERLRNDFEVGTYGAACRLFEGALVLPMLFMAVLFPAFAESAGAASSRGLPPTALLRKALLWLMTIACVTSLGLAVLAPAFLGLLFGDAYSESVPLLRALAPSLLFICPNYALTHFLVALRGQRDNAWLAAWCVAANISLNLFAIPRWGAMGAAVSTVLTEALLCSLASFAVYRRVRSGATTSRGDVSGDNGIQL